MASSAQGKEIQRKLKIKTGTAKRLGKELESYEKEELKQQERIEKLKRDGADEYDVKKQIEVLQDTQQMIPDTVKRLVAAQKDLEEHMQLVEQHAEASQIKGTEDWTAATTILNAITEQASKH